MIPDAHDPCRAYISYRGATARRGPSPTATTLGWSMPLKLVALAVVYAPMFSLLSKRRVQVIGNSCHGYHIERITGRARTRRDLAGRHVIEA